MFQRIIKFSIENKLVIGVLSCALVVWGVWSLVHLPFDATPDITNNQVQIIVTSQSTGAEEMEQNVTMPIEMALANLPRVKERRSISRSGMAVVTMVFEDGADNYWARELIDQQLGAVKEKLPENVDVELAPISTGLGEIYHYTIRAEKGYEDKYSLTELRTIQDWIVRRQLSGTPGIAEVSGWGGYVKQYEVDIDLELLNAMGVTIAELYTALNENNENTGGGYIERLSNQYYIRGLGLVKGIEDIERIVVKTQGGVPVLVGDVAHVHFGHATRYGAVTRNGEGEVVAGITLMLKGENFQEVIKNVKSRIADIQKNLPEGVVIEPFIDRTQLVDRVTRTIGRNLTEGGIIVIFILVLFLGNYRAGLVVASVIPLAMLFAFGMMRVFGVSGNLMSLGAIDFGLIVDGAVIIVEAVVARMATSSAVELRDFDHLVYESSSRIRQSAAFGEIIIMIVYLPMMTLVGIEGKMFRPMALTIFFAILGAFILSLTYVPMMSAVLLKQKTTNKLMLRLEQETSALSKRIMKWIESWYLPLVDKCLNHGKAVIISMVALFVGALLLMSTLGAEFIPTLEEGDFAAEVSMAQGTSLSQMVETCSKAEEILKQEFPEIKQVVTRIGSAEIPTDPMPVERADILIALQPKAQWTSAKTKNDLQEKMEEALGTIPGLDVEMSQPIQMRNNELFTGIRQDVAVKIYGGDTEVLAELANKVKRLIKDIDGVGSLYVEKVNGLPQLQVEYDRQNLAKYGISIRQANDVLQSAFAGKIAGKVTEDNRQFDIVLRIHKDEHDVLYNFEELLVPSPSGVSVPLRQLATISYKEAPAQISHEDGERSIFVGFNVKGRDMNSTVKDIREVLDENMEMPVGYHYSFGGEFENLQSATDRLMVAIPLALLLILLLLYATLKSVRETLFVASAIPLSSIGGIVALWLRGMPMSISAGIGFIALFGVAVLNGIVLVGQFNALQKQGVTDIRRRILEGCEHRLRPVVMTALVASFGFLPMALSTSDGAEVQRPLATVVIGGLLTATLLTLFVIPVIYKTFTDNKKSYSPNMKYALCSLLAAFVWGVLPAGAQSLAECIETARANNIGVRMADLQVQRAKRMEGSYFEMENTELSLSQDPTSGGSPDNALTLSQKIDFPTVYSSRRKLLKAETQVEEGYRRLTESELTRDVSSAYSKLLLWQHMEKLLSSNDSVLDKFVSIASIRFANGETNRLELMNAQRMKAENSLELREAQNEKEAANILLQQLMNTSETIVATDDFQCIRPNDEAYAFETTPEGQLLESERVQSERKLGYTRQGLWPSLNVGLRHQMVISGINPYDVDRSRFEKGNWMGFEVGVAFPLFYGSQRAKTAAAKMDVDIARTRQEQARRKADSERLVAENAVETARRSYDYYQAEGFPVAREMRRLSCIEYEAGEISYVEHVQNLSSALDMEMDNAKAIDALNQAIIQLNFIKGE